MQSKKPPTKQQRIIVLILPFYPKAWITHALLIASSLSDPCDSFNHEPLTFTSSGHQHVACLWGLVSQAVNIKRKMHEKKPQTRLTQHLVKHLLADSADSVTIAKPSGRLNSTLGKREEIGESCASLRELPQKLFFLLV